MTLQSSVPYCFKQQHVQSDSIQAPDSKIFDHIFILKGTRVQFDLVFFSQCQFPKFPLYLVPAESSCHLFCHFLASPVLSMELFGAITRLCSDLLEQSSSKAINQPNPTLCSLSHQQQGIFKAAFPLSTQCSLHVQWRQFPTYKPVMSS